jgi:hypothetical protein
VNGPYDWTCLSNRAVLSIATNLLMVSNVLRPALRVLVSTGVDLTVVDDKGEHYDQNNEAGNHIQTRDSSIP